MDNQSAKSVLSYLEWNNLLANHFFNADVAGREVLLYTTKDLIDDLGRGKNVGLSDFKAALREGPPWATREGFCQKALQSFLNWRDRNLDYPPYVAYLAFFSYVATIEGDFMPWAYYPRLNFALDQPRDDGAPPSFHRMYELWDDLDKWSRLDKGEELGRFICRIRGDWIHVGLPTYQTILSENERKYLPLIFDLAGLDPTSLPAEVVLADLLCKHGKHMLENRTIRLISSPAKEDEQLREGLIDFVQDELEDWDCIVPEDIEHPGRDRGVRVRSGLRICLEIDWITKECRSYLRFKSNRSFPEDGLSFRDVANLKNVFCVGTRDDWSSPVEHADVGSKQNLVPTDREWKSGLQLFDEENQWRVKLAPGSVRLFFQGSEFGLPDWIEAQRLQKNKEFLVACEESVASVIRVWGSRCASNFCEYAIKGLPKKWVLFKGKDVTASCRDVPLLTLPTAVRVKLDGGIKLGKGHTYIALSLPRVIIENGTGDEKVMMGDRALNKIKGVTAAFELPENAPMHQPIELTILSGENRPLRKMLKIVTAQVPLSYEQTPWRDNFGVVCKIESGRQLVRGVTVNSEISTDQLPRSLPTQLSEKIIFLGERPGQFFAWPSNFDMPPWQPIWALAKTGRDSWDVHYCGNPFDLETKEESFSDPLSDKALLREWKHIVWSQRCRTKQPSLKKIKAVWQRYVERAKNV